MPKKNHRTPQSCLHQFNPPVPPAGHPTPRPPDPQPKNAKRTLKETHAKGVPPIYLTPTEVGETPTIPNMQNEPNWPPTARPIMQNEPNFIPPRASCLLPHASIMQNKPNSSIPSAPPFPRNEPNLPPRPPRPTPKSAKRTQFTHRHHPHDQKCETNPISAPPPSCHPPIMRNEPKLPYRWRLAGFSNPNMRNEPNLQQPIYILQSTIYNPLAQSQQTNHKPLRPKHLGLFGHKSLSDKHLGGSVTQDCTGYTEPLI